MGSLLRPFMTNIFMYSIEVHELSSAKTWCPHSTRDMWTTHELLCEKNPQPITFSRLLTTATLWLNSLSGWEIMQCSACLLFIYFYYKHLYFSQISVNKN